MRHALHAAGIRRDALADFTIAARDRVDELALVVRHGERETIELLGDEQVLRDVLELVFLGEVATALYPLPELFLVDCLVERAHRNRVARFFPRGDSGRGRSDGL